MNRKLKLPGIQDPDVDILQVVLEWLEDNVSWLMVLDNADDRELFFGKASSKLYKEQDAQRIEGVQRAPLIKYIPRSRSGLILMTSRDRRVGESWLNRGTNSVIKVSPFDTKDAKQLLCTRITEKQAGKDIEIAELLETVGYLPLAISQAAAYISEQDAELASYLELLRPGDLDTQDLLEESYYDPGRDQELPNSTLQTWTISFEQIKRQKPRAADILSLMANLDRQAISDDLLRAQDERKVSFDTAISVLKAFSFIVSTGEKRNVFQIHRLVQIATQRWLEHEGVLTEWQTKATEAVTRCCQYWIAWESVNAQVVLGWSNPLYPFHSKTETLATTICLVCIILGYRYNSTEEAAKISRARLLNLVADYDSFQGRLSDAMEKAFEALELNRNLLGEDEESTLVSWNKLARARSSDGRYKEAVEIYYRVWETRRRTLGEDASLTLQSMNLYADALRDLNEWPTSVKMQRQALEVSRTTLGPNDAFSFKCMNDLANALADGGKFDEAEALQKDALSLYQEVCGNEHVDTLICMTDLAMLYLQIGGKTAESVAMLRFVLAFCERTLPKSHYSTIKMRLNLTKALRLRGDEVATAGPEGQGNDSGGAAVFYQEAESIYRQALACREYVHEYSALLMMDSLDYVVTQSSPR